MLVLTAATGTFAVYAMPGIQLTAVFGFSVTRHPFVGAVAVVIGTAYCMVFAFGGLMIGLGDRNCALQVFVVAATVVGGMRGRLYCSKRSQRAAFAQGHAGERSARSAWTGCCTSTSRRTWPAA